MVNEGPIKQILLVEDSRAQRLVLHHTLKRLGHDVTTVANAEEALALDTVFDAVVTDLTLPGIGGAALIMSLRAKWPGAATMIAISASPCPVAGADVVLTKPVTAAQLASALAGRTPLAIAAPQTRLDPGAITALRHDLGRDKAISLIGRFIAEADGVCAQAEPDSTALHHLAGAAALFGAISLNTAALAGNVTKEWPETRVALLDMISQMV
jgi:CheY-like chemotaxis protein